MRCRQFPHALKRCKRRGNISKGEKMIECHKVRLDGEGAVGQDSLDLRCEQKAVAADSIEQRLFPKPISGKKEGPRAGIPDGEGEHAVQPFKAPASILLIRMDDYLRIAIGPENVSAGFEIGTQLTEIVDLPIE